MRIRIVSLVAALLFLASAATAQVPAPPAHLIVQTGLFQFDLNGDGYSPMMAGRLVLPISTVLMMEGSLLAARPGQDFGETTTLLIPEAQVQLVLPFARLVPYIGLGAGAALDLRSSEAGGRKSFATYSGSVGGKYWLRKTLGFQVEYRTRGIGSDGGAANEFGVALLWQI